MSLAESTSQGTLPNLEPKPKTSAQPRPVSKVVMHWIRRLHLYFGLLLFPWALLYGVTAFLFNHPTAFSDQPTTTFGSEALIGTPLETRPTPDEFAVAVVAQLNEKQKPANPYTVNGNSKYVREFAFATVKAEGQTINVLIDVKQGTGTVRSTPTVERKEAEKAPFAIGSGADSGGRVPRPQGTGSGPGPVRDGIKLDNSLSDRVKQAVPTILERAGFPTGEVTVTSVPEVSFPVEADGRSWTATYNPLTGSVSGTLSEDKPATELSWRRFLLRLHTAHGYPSETNGRWYWAVIVDVMAATLCFWGLSGLLMWWQIKATRIWGFLLLVLSAVAATALGFAMHAAMTS